MGQIASCGEATSSDVRVSNVRKYSSTQAISPQYLNVFTSNWVRKFLRGLGIFAHSFVINVCLDQKIFVPFHYFFANCWSIKTLCDAGHSHFNIQQRHKQFCILDQLLNRTVQVFDRTLLQLLWKCNYLWPKNDTFKHLSSLDIDYLRYLRDTTFTGPNWYRLSLTATFILIRLTVASSVM